MTYFGLIGFDVGVLTSTKAKSADGDFEDNSDHAYPLRLALAVGGGLEYNFSGNTSAILGLKYSNGFSSVDKNKVTEKDAAGNEVEIDLPKAKLHYFEVTVGALF